MEVPQGKHAWMVKIGEKGQFVIPKEARDISAFTPATSCSSSATTSAASPTSQTHTHKSKRKKHTHKTYPSHFSITGTAEIAATTKDTKAIATARLYHNPQGFSTS